MPPAAQKIAPIEWPEDWLTLTKPAVILSESTLVCKSKMIPRALFSARSLSLGPSLSVLPLELLFLIFSYLDICSLNLLRQLSFGIKNLVDFFGPYLILIKYVPATLQVLAVTRVLCKFSVTDLFKALKSKYCFSCGDAGDLLFISLAKRCCRLCLRAGHSLQLISLAAAKECFGLSSQAVRNLPSVLMTPGRYGIREREYKSRTWIVSLSEAQEAGIRLHGSEQEIERFVTPSFTRQNVQYLLKYWNWVTLNAAGETSGRRPYPPKSQSEKPEVSYEQFNYRVSTPFPSINFNTETTVYPRPCKGCALEMTLFFQTYPRDAVDYPEKERLHLKRIQTAWWTDDFEHHIHVCEGIKKLLSK
ncbi:uncharacterized protein GIQ15_06869 [Arthroderma uncinatum]|uniref:uncharacterized protein n=1 Tax=Arthroderma uncinatum TaxID=74035 RepID=UPI00144AC70E|nr:uncharacterized protein GIQ15_06869 [Arthroderma uncinatum]KAF3479893.1 hypothetical protein GIQ15_06869 [Arthroderma uncinatum]